MAKVTNVSDSVNAKSVSIDLSALNKTKVLINNDEDRFIFLDLSDLNVPTRFEEVSPDIEKILISIGNYEDNLSVEEKSNEIKRQITEGDKKVREYIDYIFDGEVCKVCAPSGTMFDMIDGKFRWEYIIEALSSLYSDHIEIEFNKVMSRVKAHTDKYTKKKKNG